ncbi:MAG: acetyl/propionyl/methylcrotonyl-CoA carboxylase subunit alpha [Bradymonadia bacterium]
MFKRVLIANRGEIAVRVARTLRDMGISPAAIYSEPDRHALHVRMADVAVCVGPEASSESYLNMDAILDAARAVGAEAIHPGYGFLSENATFARRVKAAGLAWIGPPPEAIETMGDKLLARRTVTAAGVPVVPGTSDPVADPEHALAVATEVGFPVMIKASAGGGGKGMRRVDDPSRFMSALEAARREAAGAFGNDAVYIEKFVVGPHHIEIQLLCDDHGNAVYVGERECSVQRRHQKVIEECPSPFIDDDLRTQMGEVAVAAARACNYSGAGTVEFMVGADRNFYFLEMNTRLQVEHPVTELVYGVDLVEAQVRVAAGEPLPYTQADLQPRGHAIECRLYAEDPRTYMPSPGPISGVRWPQGTGVRVDAGIDENSVVPMAYDPMVAKLCTYGRTRAQSISRMHRALSETVVLGISTNIELHHRILKHADFVAGQYDTGILDTQLPDPATPSEEWPEAVYGALAVAQEQAASTRGAQGPASTEGGPSPWRLEGRRRAL